MCMCIRSVCGIGEEGVREERGCLVQVVECRHVADNEDWADHSDSQKWHVHAHADEDRQERIDRHWEEKRDVGDGSTSPF